MSPTLIRQYFRVLFFSSRVSRKRSVFLQLSFLFCGQMSAPRISTDSQEIWQHIVFRHGVLIENTRRVRTSNIRRASNNFRGLGILLLYSVLLRPTLLLVVGGDRNGFLCVSQNASQYEQSCFSTHFVQGSDGGSAGFVVLQDETVWVSIPSFTVPRYSPDARVRAIYSQSRDTGHRMSSVLCDAPPPFSAVLPSDFRRVYCVRSVFER